MVLTSVVGPPWHWEGTMVRAPWVCPPMRVRNRSFVRSTPTALGLGANYWFHDFEGHDFSAGAKARFKKWGIDEVLAARQKAGVAPPKLISNWMVPDNPGRLSEWVRDTGLTHGNAIGYYERRWRDEPDKNHLTFILHHGEQAVRRTWNDRRDWATIWIGNPPESSDDNVPRPDEYRSLVSLMTLQGSRWFLVFTAMSRGHLDRHL